MRSADLKRCSLLRSGNAGASPGPGEREWPSIGPATAGRDRWYRGVRRFAAGQAGRETPPRSLVTGVRLPGIGNVVGVKSAGRIRAALPTAQACWD